jgi:hypothetical protein
MDKDNEILFAIRPYESSEFEVKMENLGLKSFTTGLQLVGSKLTYVCVLSNQCACVRHNYIQVLTYSMVFHIENPDYIHTLQIYIYVSLLMYFSITMIQ